MTKNNHSICCILISIVLSQIPVFAFLCSCTNNKTTKRVIYYPTDSVINYSDSVYLDKDSGTTKHTEETTEMDFSRKSTHSPVTIPSSEPSSSKGLEKDGMFGFDQNYEDPDNNHDIDHFMNETDDEWAN